MDISPKYIMRLVIKIKDEMWKEFESYTNVENYIKKWQIVVDQFTGEPNFSLCFTNNKIDLVNTLHNIDNETLIKIAIDLGIDTPGFIPSVPLIKNVIKEKLNDGYCTALETFNNAIKQIEENPDIAVGLANSTLESIIKHILQNEKIRTKWKENDSLYDLTRSLLKEFKMYPGSTMPIEVNSIGSSLINVSQNIETLRSSKTTMHGKLSKDYLIKDTLYAYFVINVVASVGLFLISFYEKKFKSEIETTTDNEPNEIDPNDIPF